MDNLTKSGAMKMTKQQLALHILNLQDMKKQNEEEIKQLRKQEIADDIIKDNLKEENEKLKEEITKLNKKKSIKWSREFAMPLIEKLKEGNKQFEEENKNWAIEYSKLKKEWGKSEEAKHSYLQMGLSLKEENEKLKNENSELKELYKYGTLGKNGVHIELNKQGDMYYNHTTAMKMMELEKENEKLKEEHKKQINS